MAKTVRIPAKTFTRAGKTVHRKAYTKTITPKARAAARKNVKTARRAWMRMSPTAREKAMPPKRFKGMSEAQIKKAVHKKGERYVPVGGYAWIDVGRKGHHYVLAKKTMFGWKREKTVSSPAQVGLAGRKKWVGMSHKARARAMPSRKGKAGYTKKTVTKTSVLGKRYRAPVWVKK
jgi:hypothetical protein